MAAFVTDRFRYLLRYYGLDTVSEPGDLMISGDVRSFFVSEDNTYMGDVALKVRVTDNSGTVLWEGVAAGTESRWGRSYKKDNYYETLSDSLINAVNRLLSTPAFLVALDLDGGR